MIKSNKINDATTVIANRAWIRPLNDGPFPALKDIRHLVFPWKIDNVGKTPAGPITINIVVEIVDSKNEPSFDYSKGHVKQLFGTVFSGEDLPFQAVLFRADKSLGELTTPETQKLQNGDAYLATFGMITYSDSFGPHWTHLCQWKNFAATMSANTVACATYNRVDIDKPGTDYKSLKTHMFRLTGEDSLR